jgi:hypothetical protein
MSTSRYVWRQLNQMQREELLSWRKERGYPWHSPPHRPNFGHLRFLISAACLNIITTSATARNAWTTFRAICWPCSRLKPARRLRGACCQIIITHSSKRRNSELRRSLGNGAWFVFFLAR